MASSPASVPALHILASLPARPPTPPREAGHDTKSVLGPPQHFDPSRSLQTPPSVPSPVSVVTGSDAGSNRARKRVEWSGFTDYKDPPDYRDGVKVANSPLLSAPSSGRSKPIKGILKPSPSPSPAASFLGIHIDGAVSHPILLEMLESTVKQLAGSDRDSKLDAYMTLARALKASNNLPDRVALQNKMGLFVQFIQRDLTSRNENGSLDSSLANHALHLLITFLHFQAIASTIPYDFGIFIIDHAIRAFENPSIPKDVIRHLMQVVAFQNFPTKLMTSHRVGRLVAALHKIEDRVQGKSIVMSRLHIYRRLVKQSRGGMILHSDWLKDMLVDMLSTVKEIRNQAICLGNEAGFALRNDHQLFRKATCVFNAVNGDESFIDFYIKRLQCMIEDKQMSYAVPQIWSVVILFLRCPLDGWAFFNPWLKLVQKAFNRTDSVLRQEANHAWTRYACLSIIDSKVSAKTISSFCQPFLSQLRRKTSSEEAVKLRAIVLGGLCSLYYYAFTQGVGKYSNELIWDTAVQPVMMELITMESPGDCITQAARVLAGLLDVSTPRPLRNTNQIMDTAPLKPEELLPIDCKWARRNCDKIFQTVGPILEAKLTDLTNKESVAFRLWQAFVGSVAAASAKDIRVSEDTTRFLAGTSSLLGRIWSRGCDDDDLARSKFFAGVKNFIQLLADGLNILPFTEKKLPTNGPLTFEPLVTSSSTSAGKNQGGCGGSRTPLQQLFVILSAVPPGCADDEELSDLFRSIFEPFLKGRTDKARAELARELMQLLPRNALSPFGPWLLAADNMKLYLERSPAEHRAGSEKPPGPEYREVVALLERGLVCHPSLSSVNWKPMFDLVSTKVFQEFGDAGRALIVVEPLAKSILENGLCETGMPSTMLVGVMTMIFDAANLPKDRKALDDARSRLWGIPLSATQTAPVDPFDNLYKLANLAMDALYGKLPEADSLPDIERLVDSVVSFSERCLPLAMAQTIAKLQHGLCRWLQNENDEPRLREGSTFSAILGRLCDSLGHELRAPERLERKDFDLIEAILTAALQSRSPYVAKKALEAFSTLFEDDVKCSDNFRSVITSLRPKPVCSVTEDGQSSEKFDAQKPLAIGPAEEDSIIVVSPAISRAASNHSTAPGSSSSKRRKTKKRHMKTISEEEKPLKRRSSSRRRRNDSPVKVAKTAPSSPQKKLQDLTRRQRDLHERQRKTNSPKPETEMEVRAEPVEAASKDTIHMKESNGSGDLTRDATPDRATSFNDFIRSTPTPRRGQVLPMDDANDPPSSPPVPRPCPLLSEIQSRSKANASLDNWQFSSPTSSPTCRVGKAEVVSSPKTRPASPPRTRSRRRIQGRPIIAAQETKEIVALGTADTDEEGVARNSLSTPAPAGPPATPPRRRPSKTGQAPETPGSDDDEFIDARTSPEWAAHLPGEDLEEAWRGGQDPKDVSYALSEGDETGMIDLVIELESRSRKLRSSRTDDSPKTESSWDGEETKHKGVPQESPPGPKTRRGSQRVASLAAASKTEDTEASNKAKRKRKRGATQDAEGGGKRRRPSEAEGHAKGDERRDASPPVPAGRTRMETRQRLRKQKQLTVDAPETSRLEKDAQDRRARSKTETQVDEEAPAKGSLVPAQQQETRKFPKNTNKAERVLTRRELQKPLESSAGDGGHADESEPGSENIMNTLRSGLEQLRKAALPRDRMYELEDILIDMKRELYEAEKRGREIAQAQEEHY
ncbi:hypothetical protein CDD80_7308 [Ophiocordyceps camponoti-rufipedis]|uniref:Telomere-associated protein Rif1 N-terminal domain-containing protein n=1 Tax=Ophiocordyceps camponoti-rufipedis TaxID=2004952 RepID=A0A2C5ZNA0_9HYPO|nr:hypothetical protein CDD80_7308 [Ophiocordyceps camponoti-rufipedis]